MSTTTLPRGTKNGSKPDVVLDRDAEPPVGATGAILQVPIDLIDVGDNVRVTVDEIEELAASIREHGVLQPIKVRDAAGDRYLVTWGQRRLLAAKLAGFDRIPAIVDNRVQTPAELAIEQLVENLARQDLPPLERARAMRAVVDAGRTQADLARELGLAPSTVTNDLGLLEAPAKIRDAIDRGELAPAHAKALKGLAASTQAELAAEVVRRGLSAHATEELVQAHKRRAEWQKERAEEDRAKRAATKEVFEASVANVAKRKVPLDADIRVVQDYGTEKIGPALKLLEKAGYTNAKAGDRYVTARPSGGVCDCTAWRVAVRSAWVGQVYADRLTVGPACVEPKHLKAKSDAEEKDRQARWALRNRVRDQVAAAFPKLATELAAPRLLLEALLWQLLDYGLADWAHARGGKRDPWPTLRALDDATLASEIGIALGRKFDNRFSFDVDWNDVAARLPAEASPSAEEGTPA